VRELSNVALRFVVENRDRAVARISDGLRALLKSRQQLPHHPASRPADSARKEASEPRAARSAQLTDAELVAAVRAAGFQRERAAKTLGVSKSYLYKRLASIAEIRDLGDIPLAEVQAALDASGGDVTLAAARLQVSDRALRIHLKRPPANHRSR
jgi:DNA-binding NtrC family response regulator